MDEIILYLKERYDLEWYGNTHNKFFAKQSSTDKYIIHLFWLNKYLQDHNLSVDLNKFTEDLLNQFAKHNLSVTSVNLSNLSLDAIPESLNQLTSIEYLELSHNNITTIANIDNLSNITWLSLYGNQIDQLQTGNFDGLVNITWLSMRYNQISELPEELFQYNHNLQWLKLANNRLDSIPEPIFLHTPQLLGIDLSSNNIEILPRELIRPLPEIQKLLLDGNPIKLPVYLNVHDRITELATIQLQDDTLTPSSCSIKLSILPEINDLCTVDSFSNAVEIIERLRDNPDFKSSTSTLRGLIDQYVLRKDTELLCDKLKSYIRIID